MSRHFTRRAVISGAGASALAFSGAGFAGAAVTARGFVFESHNGGERRMPGDRGLAGVMVSNGCDIVRTAVDGSWSLPLAPGDSVFVIKPPHWATPRGPGGIPRFSYLYQPAGSPRHMSRAVPLVAPTGDVPASIDFALVRRDEPRAFQAFLVTDTQPDSDTELSYVRDDIIAGLLARSAAFGIHHGDVVGDNLGLYPRYLQLLGATGVPWHHCAGNHDINRDAHDDAQSRETWKRTFGPRYYAFQHAGATFLILDNVDYSGSADGRYRGMLGARQLAFVRNVLRHVPMQDLVVLSMHIPLRCLLDPTNPADTTADYQALLRLLAGRPHTVSFAGHLHATEHHYLEHDVGVGTSRPHHHHVLTAASGSWWSGPQDYRGIPSADSCDGTPNGFHVLSVDGHRYATEFVPACSKQSVPMRAIIEGPQTQAHGARHAGSGLMIPASALSEARLVVNVFDGGPRTRVSCVIDGQGRALPLQRASMIDPTVARLFAADVPRKDWVKPMPSAHIWTMQLPTALSLGPHRITVHTSDEYGRERRSHLMLEVVGSALHG
jgi:hypothetical protein